MHSPFPLPLNPSVLRVLRSPAPLMSTAMRQKDGSTGICPCKFVVRNGRQQKLCCVSTGSTQPLCFLIFEIGTRVTSSWEGHEA